MYKPYSQYGDQTPSVNQLLVAHFFNIVVWVQMHFLNFSVSLLLDLISGKVQWDSGLCWCRDARRSWWISDPTLPCSFCFGWCRPPESGPWYTMFFLFGIGIFEVFVVCASLAFHLVVFLKNRNSYIYIYIYFFSLFVILNFSSKEEAVQQVFRRFNFFYPVEVTTETTTPLEGFPWIKPSAFLATMCRMNDLGRVLGGATSKKPSQC